MVSFGTSARHSSLARSSYPVGPLRTDFLLPPILYPLQLGKDTAILYQIPAGKETGQMPKVSSKRQITLPIDQCLQVGIEPGDEIQSFVADGHITIIKKVPGAAKGLLKHVKGDTSISDEESLQSALD